MERNAARMRSGQPLEWSGRPLGGEAESRWDGAEGRYGGEAEIRWDGSEGREDGKRKAAGSGRPLGGEAEGRWDGAEGR